MASETDIANRALQLLGDKRITSLAENSVPAREMNAAFAIVRDAELRRHVWGFATTRATLAPSVTAPDFKFDYAFPVPSDFLRLHPSYDEASDWSVERILGVGTCILTNEGDVLQVQYIARVTDTTAFDALFVDALSKRLAFELCEKITNSSQKTRDLWDLYQASIADAKRVNAIEKISAESPEDTWITARL